MGDRPCHIVLIDDAGLDRLVFIKSLEKAGFQCTVTEFENPLEALAFLRGAKSKKAKPDIVVTDISMMEMDGYGVIQAIREMPHLKGIHIVVLTGFSPDNNSDKAIASGANLFFVKPISGFQLREFAILLSGKK